MLGCFPNREHRYMKSKLPLPQDKKLTVIFRVEPGCLGPTGSTLVDGFCSFAQKEVAMVDSDFVHWEILPRHDKALPEMQYRVCNKKLTHDKADQYLKLFQRSLDLFEEHLHEKIVLLIQQYLETHV